MLAYEKLDVYQRSIEFLCLSAEIIERIPKGNSVFTDQLKRASLSILLNIAEGTGKTSDPERRRFYAMARGSAMECGAILDACKVLKLQRSGKYRIFGQQQMGHFSGIFRPRPGPRQRGRDRGRRRERKFRDYVLFRLANFLMHLCDSCIACPDL
jgi:four helix bundle protein